MIKTIPAYLLMAMFASTAWAQPPAPQAAPDANKPPPPPHHRHHHHGPRAPWGSSSPSIHISMASGKPELSVECGDQASLQQCANVAESLLQKVSNMSPQPQPPKPK